ncbi:VOC family protein [Parerythrobacter jejuensis]|uniref:VOC family protein n=1 Tax=Parerythrobacter jejuensis TaxID=795812 RepID=A0A845ANV6_9SPHN|nr:VOC family protein [Parerythrobacter jejuensis]MXP31294.1 VOC family protein [Parerythrobacter jejuensis]MXP34054.1 VOC family protein [Parerythrobacter jejuensis]
MFSHVMLGANDIEASKKFYDALFVALGGREGSIDPKGRAMYVHNGNVLMLSKPIDGDDACGANGGTIGFAVDSPEQGDAWHAAGVANGGTAIEDPPGIRTNPMGSIYLAYLRDPAGNKICALKQMG